MDKNQNKNTQAKVEATEEKVSIKEKAVGFAEKHPKLVKALKIVGLVAGGAAVGAAGTAIAINKKKDDDELEDYFASNPGLEDCSTEAPALEDKGDSDQN